MIKITTLSGGRNSQFPLSLSSADIFRFGASIPRRKYGRMVKPLMPVDPKKCRYCKLGWNCPTHGERNKTDDIVLEAPKDSQ